MAKYNMTRNPFTKVDRWAEDVRARSALNKKELDITVPYYAKLVIDKPEDELTDTPKLREVIRNLLSPLLKSSQTANAFIEYLGRTDDLTNFYRLEAPFLRTIQGVHRLDLTYLINLWTKYRTAVLKEVERMKAAETQADYEYGTKDLELLRAPTPIEGVETPREMLARVESDFSRGVLPLYVDKDGTVVRYSTPQRVQTAIKSLEKQLNIVRPADPRLIAKLVS